jgi:hypothetical protein
LLIIIPEEEGNGSQGRRQDNSMKNLQDDQLTRPSGTLLTDWRMRYLGVGPAFCLAVLLGAREFLGIRKESAGAVLPSKARTVKDR